MTTQSQTNQISAEQCRFTEAARIEPESPAGLSEKEAIREAQRCLGSHFCRSCDLCRYLCPELCITRNSVTGALEIDLDYCKGCGICAFICPKKAIKMEREE